MEQTTETGLFQLEVDASVQSYLGETARWAKFIGMTGLIGSALLTLVCLGVGLFTINGGPSENGDYRNTLMGLGFFAVSAVLMFFPSWFLNRFASHMQKALRTNDQDQLISSLRSLKSCYRFIGILTIIYLGFVVLIIIGNLFGTVRR